MKRNRMYLLLIVLVCIVAACFYGYKEFNRKPAGLESVKPLARTDAASLMQLYSTDEQQANTIYLGKPIDVTGVIAEINNQQDTLINVMLGDGADMHKVSCLLDTQNAFQIKRFKAGDKITLRGICTGYLMDVELNRCVVIR